MNIVAAEMNLWFSLALLFLGVELISAFDPQNAYSNDINKCLFTKWTTASGSKIAVLSSNPECKGTKTYSKLCYGLYPTGIASFAVCYNKVTLTPAYTAHVVEKVKGEGRHDTFETDTGKYAPKPQAQVNDYEPYQQQRDFPGFNVSTDHFCSKGHLTPNSDFGPEKERALTFILTNIAPQWQKFNGGNWNVLESALQKYINAPQQAGRKVYVFNGVGGKARDTSGNLYLMNKRVQAPKYFWKAICDPIAKQSVVFVGENPVGSSSKTKLKGCNNQTQTHENGVMQCLSWQDAKKRHKYSDFILPPFYDGNCRIKTRGTFLDTYIKFT